MQVLVINCGSSSIKAAVIDTRSGDRVATAKVERLSAGEHRAALEVQIPKLLAGHEVGAVGHRVVHGGSEFVRPTRLDDAIVDKIDALSSLAPLHNPANVAGIRAARDLLADVPHVAVFDTAFHATMPTRAKTYALPDDISAQLGLQRYGFHGTSHQWVARQAAASLDADPMELRVITCHLGNGCSVAAVENGRSVDTSMGMTPLEGLVMGTRSGDLDPGVVIHLMRNGGLDVDAVDELLNRRSGLAGLSGVGKDMRDIEKRAADGDDRCRRAVQVFCHRARKYIGAYAAVMGGVDAIVMTGGIGQNSALVRHRLLQRLEFLGARLDEDANRDATVDRSNPVATISMPHSRVKLLVIATDEERAIAEHAAKFASKLDCVEGPKTIPIAVSARHIHLTRESVDVLFGEGHELTPRNPLSQPGQFACEETLDIVGPKRTIEGVRILGPTRRANQVEISRTDEFHLGVDAPVRQSGDVKNSPGITLVGPKGRLTITEGLICAWRHIHMTTKDAEQFGVKDRDMVEVRVSGGPRDLVFGDVLVRVSDKYALEMHIDTDEANAAELSRGAAGMLEATEGQATLMSRKTSFDQAV